MFLVNFHAKKLQINSSFFYSIGGKSRKVEKNLKNIIYKEKIFNINIINYKVTNTIKYLKSPQNVIL